MMNGLQYSSSVKLLGSRNIQLINPDTQGKHHTFGLWVATHICDLSMLCRTNQYDGVDEFWVDVRTTGSHTYSEKELEQEKHTRTMESGETFWH